MATLSSVALILKAFYRLVGTTTSDAALVEQGESADDVAYLCLNHGTEAAQRFMISCGMVERWRKRSSVLSWSGSDAADGGRYSTLPTDFLRFSMSGEQSSLMTANGERWGQEITADYDAMQGNFYYLKNDQLWIAVGASPPGSLYLDYQFRHPDFTSGVTINFPAEARGLCVAYAAQVALADAWFPDINEARVLRNVAFWEREARKISRRSRAPRTMTAPRVVGTRYFA